MENDCLISVIIPVYNGERYLAEAIESVLAQTYRRIEVIVVDDGSTDRSAEVARRFMPPVKYSHQPNEGSASARNRGTSLAQGSLFAFLDADDIWVPDKLERQVEVLEAHLEVEAVFGHVKQFHSPELDLRTRERIRCPEEALPGYMSSAILIRREAFFRIGLYETQWQIGEDMSWILRAKEKKLRMVMLPDLLYLRRLHANNKGITQRQLTHQYLHVLKASLDRRRKKNGYPDDG